jgi:glycosyltransferase involved in cell wall biosynthesis
MGGDLLIQAFREVAPANAVLVFLGEGRQRKALEKLREADGRIHFLDARRDAHDFLKDLDLFVSPAREGAFGLAIIEAMGAGLPVIAAMTDSAEDCLKGQPATLVEIGSVSALSVALSRHTQKPVRSPCYDLWPFDAAMKVDQVMAFYAALDDPPREDTGYAAAL